MGQAGKKQTQTEIGPIACNWKLTDLADIAEPPQYGFTATASKAGDTRFLRITDIEDWKINWAGVPYCTCPKEKLDKYLLQSGDIVFARIGATTGKSALVTNPPNAVFASYLIRVRTRESIDACFLSQFFQSNSYWRQIEANKNANLKKGVSGSVLKTLLIPKPPLPEQRRIAAVLSLVERAIEQQDRLITLTTELKRALMHELFTEGTRGEPQKQTEIGPIPESWEVVEIGGVFKFTSGKTKPKDTNTKRTDDLSVPVYGGNGVLGYSAESFLNRSTLILGRVGEYCGCAHLTEDICWVTDNALYVKQKNQDVNLVYIRNHFEFLNLNKYSNKMGQPLITQGIINKVKFGLPSADEQGELADIFSLIDIRIETLSHAKDNLQGLFRTLLHQLMTAEIRVGDLDLSELGLDAEDKVAYRR